MNASIFERRPRPVQFAATLAAALTLAACASSGPADPADPEWLQPSRALATQIDEQIQRLPWTHGAERVEMIRWLASVGEPAYDPLLDLCLDPRPEVAGSALAALGATGDSRLVAPLNALDLGESASQEVLLERARTLLRLGDWSQVGRLVDGLSDESLWTRAWCAQSLYEVTQLRFGFDPRADADERQAAVAQWRRWLADRRGEGILGKATGKKTASSSVVPR